MTREFLCVVAVIVGGTMLLMVVVHSLSRFLVARWPLASAETCNKILNKTKSASIRIHVGAWVLGVLCFALMSAGIDVMLYGCVIALLVAYFSAMIALPVALVELFHSREKPMLIRLKFAGVALMATLVLACVITFLILTAGRH